MSTGAGKRLENRVRILESIIKDQRSPLNLESLLVRLWVNGLPYTKERVCCLVDLVTKKHLWVGFEGLLYTYICIEVSCHFVYIL